VGGTFLDAYAWGRFSCVKGSIFVVAKIELMGGIVVFPLFARILSITWKVRGGYHREIFPIIIYPYSTRVPCKLCHVEGNYKRERLLGIVFPYFARILLSTKILIESYLRRLNCPYFFLNLICNSQVNSCILIYIFFL